MQRLGGDHGGEIGSRLGWFLQYTKTEGTTSIAIMKRPENSGLTLRFVLGTPSKSDSVILFNETRADILRCFVSEAQTLGRSIELTFA